MSAADQNMGLEDMLRLTRLARRFGSPDLPTGPPTPDGCTFELWWHLAPLVFGLSAVLSERDPLFTEARRAENDRTLVPGIWQAICTLPYEKVERMIETVRVQRGLWDLEAELDRGGDE